jgi:hypothetical protein
VSWTGRCATATALIRSWSRLDSWFRPLGTWPLASGLEHLGRGAAAVVDELVSVVSECNHVMSLTKQVGASHVTLSVPVFYSVKSEETTELPARALRSRGQSTFLALRT